MKGRPRKTLAVLVVLLCAAAALWIYRTRPSIQRRLEAAAASSVTSFDFAAETPFGWDRMFVFGPYTSESDVEKSLGFQWPDYHRSSIRSSDSICLVVFVQDKSIVHWYDQPRSIELGRIVNANGYAPSEAQFVVNRSSGHVELQIPAVARETTTRPGD